MNQDPSSTPAASSPAPPFRPARWVGLFIAAYILFQLLLPLRYYLQASTADERFAWRMFSYEGMHKCDARIDEVIERDGRRFVQPLDLTTLPITYDLKKNRPQVIKRFMSWRCDQPGVVQVRFTLLCTSPTGEKLAPQHFWMERSERVVHEGEPGS